MAIPPLVMNPHAQPRELILCQFGGSCLIDVQSVAHADFRDQEAWLARIGFYLLPQLLDVRAQSACIALPAGTPHLADELSLRNDHAGAAGQTLDEPEF